MEDLPETKENELEQHDQDMLKAMERMLDDRDEHRELHVLRVEKDASLSWTSMGWVKRISVMVAACTLLGLVFGGSLWFYNAVKEYDQTVARSKANEKKDMIQDALLNERTIILSDLTRGQAEILRLHNEHAHSELGREIHQSVAAKERDTMKRMKPTNDALIRMEESMKRMNEKIDGLVEDIKEVKEETRNRN